MGKLTLLLGGARSGKSTYAEKLAARHSGPVVYIATAQALDDEMVQRIAAHRRKRPDDWQTLELPFGLGTGAGASDSTAASAMAAAQVVLLDCLTLLISNLILRTCPDLDQPDEAAATAAVQAELERLEQAIQNSPADWIIVSNEVGLGLVPPFPIGRIYRDLLGWANQRLARRADKVLFLIAGIPMRLVPDE